jgi:hypothetical protein
MRISAGNSRGPDHAARLQRYTIVVSRRNRRQGSGRAAFAKACEPRLLLLNLLQILSQVVDSLLGVGVAAVRAGYVVRVHQISPDRHL